MKAAFLAGAIPLTLALTLGMAQTASAQCTCGGTVVAKPGVLLSGKTACAVRGNEQWQEYHAPGGALIDYKGGTPEQVGTWSSGTSTVTYNYGPGAVYTWSVCRVGASGPYNFCNAADTVMGATLKTGQTSCP